MKEPLFVNDELLGDMAGAHSGEDDLNELAARWCSGHKASALALIDDVLEKFGEAARGAGMDELRRVNNLHHKAWLVLLDYISKQKSVLDVIMAVRTMCLVLDFTTAAGADNPTDLARLITQIEMRNSEALSKKSGIQILEQFNFEKRLLIKKQTVHKCERVFRKALNMPPSANQRDEAACRKMSASRKKQLAENRQISATNSNRGVLTVKPN